MFKHGFFIGDWSITPDQGLIRQGDQEVHLSPRVMNLLCFLAERQGDVVSRGELLDNLWQGMIVSDDVLTQCVSELRASLGDKRAGPRYIKTVPKKGYLLIAGVRRIAPPTTRPIDRRFTAFSLVVLMAVLFSSSVLAFLSEKYLIPVNGFDATISSADLSCIDTTQPFGS